MYLPLEEGQEDQELITVQLCKQPI